MAQPTFPYLNRKIKCSFPWYRNIEEVTRNTVQCGYESEDCVPFAQWVPQTNLPPFQIFATEASQYGLATPTSWGIYDLDGNLVQNLAANLSLLTVVQFNDPPMEYLVYNGGALAAPLPSGTYESRISIASGRVFYSETFKVICVDDATSCFLRLKWTSCGNVGTVYYEAGFQNVLYLDPATFVVRPSPELKLDNNEGGQGQQNTSFVRKEVTYNLDLGQIPWYLLDALTEIPLLNTPAGNAVTLQSAFGTDPIHDVDVSYTWSQDNTCLALSSLAFKLQDADANGSCCETWDPPCLVPCAVVSGTTDTTPLVANAYYVMAGSNAYVRYVGGGFTTPVACNGLVTGTRGYPDSYWTGSSWEPVAQMTVELSGDDFYVTAVIFPRYNGTLQYSTDGTTWTDLVGPYDADDWAAGVTVTIPEGAEVRMAVVFGTCVIGYSEINTAACPEPSLAYKYAVVSPNVYNLRVTMSTTDGFTPGDVYVSSPDGDTPTQTFGALPDTLTFGPFDAGITLTVHVANASGACNYSHEMDTPAFACSGPGMMSFAFSTGTGNLYAETDTGFFALRASDGSITVGTSAVSATPIPDSYCLWPSDASGTQSGSLTRLSLSSTLITAIDVSSNTALTNLDLGSTPITAIDVSSNTALTRLTLSSTPITAIDVSSNTALTNLSLSSTLITAIDVSSNTALIGLNLSYTPITAIDVSSNTALIGLYLVYTPITAIDVSSNTALTNLDLSSCVNLVSLDAHGLLHISSLYITGCSSLNSINLSGCALSQTLLNNTLVTLDGLGRTDVVADFSGGTTPHPTSTGLTAYNNLIAKGCTITVN